MGVHPNAKSEADLSLPEEGWPSTIQPAIKFSNAL